MKLKFNYRALLFLLVIVLSAPTYAFQCVSISGYCLQDTGTTNSDHTIGYIYKFSVPGSSQLISSTNFLFEVSKESSDVIFSDGTNRITIGKLGRVQPDTFEHVSELILNSDIKFSMDIIRRGKRISCTTSALGTSQKWITPIADVQMNASNSQVTLNYRDIIIVGEMARGGVLGDVFCHEGISWQ